MKAEFPFRSRRRSGKKDPYPAWMTTTSGFGKPANLLVMVSHLKIFTMLSSSRHSRKFTTFCNPPRAEALSCARRAPLPTVGSTARERAVAIDHFARRASRRGGLHDVAPARPADRGHRRAWGRPVVFVETVAPALRSAADRPPTRPPGARPYPEHSRRSTVERTAEWADNGGRRGGGEPVEPGRRPPMIGPLQRVIACRNPRESRFRSRRRTS